MKHEQSNEQVTSYRDNGFLVVEDFLDADELELWRETTEEAVSERLRDQSGLTNQAAPDEFYAQVFTQAIRLLDTHEGMREIMLDSRLGRVAATLAGVDGVRLWHDQALFKPPYGNPTAWHLDCPYWSFFSRDAISLWVALDDATLQNGCMCYLPGTHRAARFDNVAIGHNMRDLFQPYPDWKTIEAVAAPVRAGGAIFHNGLIAHGAGANMTARPRRAMTCGYMPAGSVFNGQRNILPEEYFASLQPGDVLEDDARNPLVWSRS